MTTAIIQATAQERRATRRAFTFVNPIRAYRERRSELDREIKESAENLAALEEARALLVGALGKLGSNADETNADKARPVQ